MSVIKIRVDPVDYTSVARQVLHWSHVGESRYICHANVHMLMEAYDSFGFSQVVDGADLVTPDGMPLVWMMRLKGAKRQQRVYGPTLMLHVLESAAKEGIPVGFYGSSPQVLGTLVDKMNARFDALKIVYSYSPPFRALTREEDEAHIDAINRSGARILFVGLGCPRQEIWMAEHRDRINAVMLGVGAAFDFHAGLKSQAPLWIQHLGLEWLFRLLTEPRRLWRRYFYHNSRFIFLAVADLLGFLR